jgi:hypothetical protein
VVSLCEGAIVSDIRVDLPRPRDAAALIEDPAFLALRRSLSEVL